jgi:hypothetical protein
MPQIHQKWQTDGAEAPTSDKQQATTMNKVLINCHNRQVNKYFIFVLALTLSEACHTVHSFIGKVTANCLGYCIKSMSTVVRPFLMCTVNLDKCWYPSAMAMSNRGIQMTSTIPLNLLFMNQVVPVNPTLNPFHCKHSQTSNKCHLLNFFLTTGPMHSIIRMLHLQHNKQSNHFLKCINKAN